MKTSVLTSPWRVVLSLVFAATTLTATEPTPSAPTSPATPVFTSDQAVRKVLADLDRVLDETSNPQLEESLRKNFERLEASDFQRLNPEVASLIKQQPGVIPALKHEPRFLFHRYIAQRAGGALLRSDVVALDKFLAAHLAIRKALDADPSQILEAKFLVSHPALGEFFDVHPSLSSVLLEKPVSNNS